MQAIDRGLFIEGRLFNQMATHLPGAPRRQATSRGAMTSPADWQPNGSLGEANRADIAAHTLASRILRGELAPGTRLPEIELAAALEVSRNTLREAIKILATEGLLELLLAGLLIAAFVFLAARGLVQLQRHRSATVSTLSADSVRDLYRMRRLFELSAIEASTGRPAEGFHEIGAAIEQLTQAATFDDPAAIIEADLAFHQAVVRLHGSERIQQAFTASLDELRLGLALLDARTEPTLGGLVDDHRAMYGLLLRGEQDGCRDLLGAHLVASEEQVLTALERAGNGGSNHAH